MSKPCTRRSNRGCRPDILGDTASSTTERYRPLPGSNGMLDVEHPWSNGAMPAVMPGVQEASVGADPSSIARRADRTETTHRRAAARLRERECFLTCPSKGDSDPGRRGTAGRDAAMSSVSSSLGLAALRFFDRRAPPAGRGGRSQSTLSGRTPGRPVNAGPTVRSRPEPSTRRSVESPSHGLHCMGRGSRPRTRATDDGRTPNRRMRRRAEPPRRWPRASPSSCGRQRPGCP